MDEPRSFQELATHARIVQEETNTAQGSGYIVSPGYGADHDVPHHHPSLPGFQGGLGSGSANLRSPGERVAWPEFNNACNHIRFLEHVVERLAAQLAEVCERLDPS